MGLLLLLGAYLQPYSESNATAMNVFKLHPGFTPTEYPILIAVGVPLLGIALGAIADGLRPFVPLRLLLGAATVALTAEAVLSLPSSGLFLLPAAAAGVAASILTFGPQTSGAA